MNMLGLCVGGVLALAATGVGSAIAQTTGQVSTGVVSTPLKAHSSKVNALVITPDGKMLASASDDKTIKLWSLSEGLLLATLKEHTGPVNALAVSGDGKSLVSGSGYWYIYQTRDATVDTIRVWALPAGRLLSTLNRHKTEGKVFYVLTSGGSLVSTEEQGGVLSLALAPDGKALFSGSRDTTVRKWTLPEGGTPSMLLDWGKGHGRSVDALALTPDGKMLASGSNDKTIKLWALPEGRLVSTLQGHTSYVQALAFTPDGMTLVSASREDSVARPASGVPDNTLRLWALPDGQMLAKLEGHTSGVNAVAITPDGKTVASGSRDKTIRLWSLPEGRSLGTLEGHTTDVNALAMAPDGNTLVSADEAGVIMVWALNRRESRRFLSDPALPPSRK